MEHMGYTKWAQKPVIRGPGPIIPPISGWNNLRQTHLFEAIYRGPKNLYLQLVGANLVN